MTPIDQRIRCDKCGNFERFYAHRSPEEDVMSRCLLIQKQGRLYRVKGSMERRQADVPSRFYRRPDIVVLQCTDCGYDRSGYDNSSYLGIDQIMFDRIEKEYWRPDDDGPNSSTDQE